MFLGTSNLSENKIRPLSLGDGARYVCSGTTEYDVSEQIITVEKTKQGKGEVKSEGRPWVNHKMASDSL